MEIKDIKIGAEVYTMLDSRMRIAHIVGVQIHLNSNFFPYLKDEYQPDFINNEYSKNKIPFDYKLVLSICGRTDEIIRNLEEVYFTKEELAQELIKTAW